MGLNRIKILSKPSWALATALIASFLLFQRFYRQYDPLNLASRHGEAGLELFPGEVLLHGIREGPYFDATSPMPLARVEAALVYNHFPHLLGRMASVGMRIARWVLAFQLGWLLCPNILVGLGAMALVPVLPSGQVQNEALLYSMLILLVANLVVWRAQAPSLWRSATLGIGIGLSLLCQSPLFLFPAVLAGFILFLPGRKEASRARIGHAVVLCALPYLVLSPWVFKNWKTDHRLILLEDHRADDNVVGSALGHVFSFDGAAEKLAGVSPGRSVLPWAVRESLFHPWRFLGGFWKRLKVVAMFHPFILLFGLAALWDGLSRREHAETGLLAAYFVVMYCLMAVLSRYFEPIWPVWAALIAAAIGHRLNGFDQAGDHPRAWLMWIYFAPTLLLGLFTSSLLVRYALTGDAAAGSLDRALCRNPDDPCLWYLRGRLCLREGKLRQAADSFSKSVALRPDRYSFKFAQAWALTALDTAPWGMISAISPKKDGSDGDYDHQKTRTRLLDMLWHLQSGETSQAAEIYQSVREEWFALHFSNFPRETQTDLRLLRNLTQDDANVDGTLGELLAAWPDSKRLKLLERLKEIPLVRIDAVKDGINLNRSLPAQNVKKIGMGGSFLKPGTNFSYCPQTPMETSALL